MLLGVLFYLLLAASLTALLLAPVRDWAQASTRRWWQSGRRAAAAWTLGTQALARHAGRGVRHLVAGSTGMLRRRALPLAAALALLMLLPLLAWSLRGLQRVDGLDGAERAVDQRVAALLQGEELVAPPPLPPALFMTAEVQQWLPMAQLASRQWELLDAAFRQRLLLAFRLVRERHGYDMVLLEGWRSPQRQAALAALGPSVTRAGPNQSLHQFGLAADCAFLRDGKVVISERDPWAMQGYQAYGEVARSLGLTWGGDWRSPRDYGHVEWRRDAAR
ncbi:M15 family metallopeptidase [Azohydromonas lata]|uniref:M15 family metallopeptidase n=1 Tax=Azohydromonas lata TaxID=45677 RepID=UPI000834E5CD|nr:M15 family metallopeptidase [Azohydromonas lata]